MLSHLVEQSSLSKIKEELRAYLKKQFSSVLLAGSSSSKESFFLEQPRNLEHGHLAWPLFSLAKSKSPHQLAEELSQQIRDSLPPFLKIL